MQRDFAQENARAQGFGGTTSISEAVLVQRAVAPAPSGWPCLTFLGRLARHLRMMVLEVLSDTTRFPSKTGDPLPVHRSEDWRARFEPPDSFDLSAE